MSVETRPMNCPECGAEIPGDSRFAHLVVCEFCRSVVVVDEKVARISGKMAALTQSTGPLYVGATGRLGKQHFQVLGRLRYGYANGYWDEWFLSSPEGRTFWISEDEGDFELEVPDARIDLPQIDFPLVNPGAAVTLGDLEYHIDEKDVAECEGGEGQLPFAVVSGERVPFLDLSSGERFATIEFDLDDGPRVFVGKRIDPKDLHIDIPKSEAAGDTLAVERAASEGRRERVVRSGERVTSIKCEHCAASLEVPALGQHVVHCPSCNAEIDLSRRRIECPSCQVTVTLAGGRGIKQTNCGQCGAVLDVSRAVPTAIGNLVDDRRPRVSIALGQTFDDQDVRYRVIGHVRFEEREGYQAWATDEFLLFAESVGYRWLAMEDGHFTLFEEVRERPHGFDPRVAVQRRRFTFLDRTWTVFERCDHNYRVSFVDGELPWVAAIGDMYAYMDAIAPPEVLSAEWTANEMEWHCGRYLTREQVAEALGVAKDVLPDPVGIAPNQPYPGSSFRWQSVVIMAVCAVAALVFGVGAFFQGGKRIADFPVTARDYGQEYVTDSFKVTQPDTVCELDMRMQATNAWAYLDVALLDDQDRALLDFSAEVSYYEGVEGGEHWTEGSRSTSKVFKVDQPGAYRLLLLGQGGDRGSPDVRLSITEGVTLARYYFLIFLFSVGWIVAVIGHRVWFEAKRWSPVLEGDDDDD